MERKFSRSRERSIAVLMAGAFLLGAWLVADGVRLAGRGAGPVALAFEDLDIPAAPSAPPSDAPAARAGPLSGASLKRAAIDGSMLEDASEPAAGSEIRRRPSVSTGRLALRDDAVAEGSVRRLSVGSAAARTTPSARLSVALAPSVPEAVRHRSIAERIERPEPPVDLRPKIRRSVQAASDSMVLAIDAIMEWMRLNGSRLPPGIRRHVGQREGDLTARAMAAHEGSSYEVFLLTRVPVREIHVVLVRGEETYYLIDRSFQREGRSFRTGFARRASGIIQGVVSEEQAASSHEASRFYDVFLAWWDNEKTSTMTRAWILICAAMGIAGCRSTAVLPEPMSVEASVPNLPGVDSTVVARAAHLADGAFVPPEKEAESALLKEEGRLLATFGAAIISDSLAFLPLPDVSDTITVKNREEAVRAFNDGARLLESHASEPDSVRARAFLAQAQARFEAALRANPFDEETRYWLARVYRTRAIALGEDGAEKDAIAVLRRLFAMDQSRHDYAGILADAIERQKSRKAQAEAASLWLLAAQLAADDTLVAQTPADSAAIFNYYVRGSRAGANAGDGDLALAALDRAEAWVRAAEDLDLVAGDRSWILWDEGNLATRRKWDSLLVLSQSDVQAAAAGIRTLLPEISKETARAEVRHHLALLQHALGRNEDALGILRQLWLESDGADSTAAAHRVLEDYGTLLFNLGMERKLSGDRVAALAYLLQSEETGYTGAARSALEVALLLNNNVEAAHQVALRAVDRMDQLDENAQRQLLRFMVELERRRGNRESALRYLRNLQDVGQKQGRTALTPINA